MDKGIINKIQKSDISSMLEKLTYTSSKIDKQEEKLTEVTSKLSTYEGYMDKVIINKM